MAGQRRQIYRSAARIQGCRMSLIPTDKYKEILAVLPILCVDIVIKNPKGEYMLLKRSNEPKKDQWWVIGGRVLKGETLEQAVVRKVKQETNIEVKSMRPIGYYELVQGVNPFGLPFEYHTVSVVFETVLSSDQKIMLDDQSSEYKFAKELPSDFDMVLYEPLK